jgi:hypothetical protein
MIETHRVLRFKQILTHISHSTQPVTPAFDAPVSTPVHEARAELSDDGDDDESKEDKSKKRWSDEEKTFLFRWLLDTDHEDRLINSDASFLEV